MVSRVAPGVVGPYVMSVCVLAAGVARERLKAVWCGGGPCGKIYPRRLA